jgi:hypothetical protein
MATGPQVLAVHHHAILAESRRLAEAEVIQQVASILKGNTMAESRPMVADPGVIYVDVGGQSGGVRRFLRLLEQAMPTDYIRASHQNLKLKMHVVFVNPEIDMHDEIRQAVTPHPHRRGEDRFESYRIIQDRLRGANPYINALHAQFPNYQVVYNFTHSLYYMEDQDLAGMIDGAHVFATVHNFYTTVSQGLLPIHDKEAEFAWRRETNHDATRRLREYWKNSVIFNDYDDHGIIEMAPLGPGGSSYVQPDITYCLNKGILRSNFVDEHFPQIYSEIADANQVGTTNAVALNAADRSSDVMPNDMQTQTKLPRVTVESDYQESYVATVVRMLGPVMPPVLMEPTDAVNVPASYGLRKEQIVPIDMKLRAHVGIRRDTLRNVFILLGEHRVFDTADTGSYVCSVYKGLVKIRESSAYSKSYIRHNKEYDTLRYDKLGIVRSTAATYASRIDVTKPAMTIRQDLKAFTSSLMNLHQNLQLTAEYVQATLLESVVEHLNNEELLTDSLGTYLDKISQVRAGVRVLAGEGFFTRKAWKYSKDSRMCKAFVNLRKLLASGDPL